MYGVWVVKDHICWLRRKCCPNYAGTVPPLTSKSPHFLFVPKVAFQPEQPDSENRSVASRISNPVETRNEKGPRGFWNKGDKSLCVGLLQTAIIKVIFYKCLRQRADRLPSQAQLQRHTPRAQWHLQGIWTQSLLLMKHRVALESS